MAAYSKLVHYSCYEVGHTWTPSCSRAVIDIGLHAFKESFKIYAPLYLVAALLRKKNKKYFQRKLLPEILQSTAFLGSNAFLFIGSFCVWRWVAGMYCFFNVIICGVPASALAMSIERKDRRLLGKFTCASGGFVPALCSTFLSILLERKGRRGILAMYVTNLAVETLYRMAAFRGYVTPVENGEVLLFSVVAAVYMYLYRFLVGPWEAGPLDPRPGSRPPPAVPPAPPLTLVDAIVGRLPAGLRRQVETWRRGGPRHRLCAHQHACLAAALQSGVRLYIMGYGLQALIKVVGSLGQLTRRPRAMLNALLHPDNAAFGKFLATFVTVFQAVNCVLRWSRDKDDALHGLLSGFLAGWSMMFYKSSTIAMYMTSKLAEVLWFKGVEKGVLPLIKCADILIYTVSTSIVFHAAVFEPHAIRAAYWKFLVRLTNGRFIEMNRKLLDVFGTSASRAFPNFWPKYDPRFTNLPVTMPTSL